MVLKKCVKLVGQTHYFVHVNVKKNGLSIALKNVQIHSLFITLFKFKYILKLAVTHGFSYVNLSKKIAYIASLGKWAIEHRMNFLI